MKSKIALLIFILAAASTAVQAQMDSQMLNQWLNQMNADANQRQQQMGKDLEKIFESEVKRQKSQATATCLLLPGGNDTFFAYVTLLYLGQNDIELIKANAFGDETRLSPSSYSFAYGTIITSAIFAPGTRITIRHKETGKILSTNKVPPKSSEQYQTFVQNSYIIAKSLSSQGYNIPTETFRSGHNSNNTNNRTSTCSLCGGKGWIAGSKTATYGSTTRHWCEECQKTVGPSHSHDRCPSCSGLGYMKK